MKKLIAILAVGLLVACGGSDEAPTAPQGQTPGAGVSKTFDVNTGNNFQYCTELYGASGSGPDLYCIDKGYEKATSFTKIDNCLSGAGNHPGP